MNYSMLAASHCTYVTTDALNIFITSDYEPKIKRENTNRGQRHALLVALFYYN